MPPSSLRPADTLANSHRAEKAMMRWTIMLSAKAAQDQNKEMKTSNGSVTDKYDL